MSSSSSRGSRIFIAERPGTWRSALAEALRSTSQLVELVDDGQTLLRLLVSHDAAPDAVVIGSGLTRIEGQDALYQAAEVHRELPRVRWPVREVFLISGIRNDAELIQLFRSRGVTQFLCRTDPLELTLVSILNALYRQSRQTPRVAAKIQAKISLRGSEASGTLVDVSRKGACVLFDAGTLRVVPETGDEINFEFVLDDASFRVQAEVRRVQSRNSPYGIKLAVGVRFKELEPTAMAGIERVLIGGR